MRCNLNVGIPEDVSCHFSILSFTTIQDLDGLGKYPYAGSSFVREVHQFFKHASFPAAPASSAYHIWHTPDLESSCIRGRVPSAYNGIAKWSHCVVSSVDWIDFLSYHSCTNVLRWLQELGTTVVCCAVALSCLVN